jgi:hypothetical protein
MTRRAPARIQRSLLRARAGPTSFAGSASLPPLAVTRPSAWHPRRVRDLLARHRGHRHTPGRRKAACPRRRPTCTLASATATATVAASAPLGAESSLSRWSASGTDQMRSLRRWRRAQGGEHVPPSARAAGASVASLTPNSSSTLRRSSRRRSAPARRRTQQSPGARAPAPRSSSASSSPDQLQPEERQARWGNVRLPVAPDMPMNARTRDGSRSRLVVLVDPPVSEGRNRGPRHATRVSTGAR